MPVIESRTTVVLEHFRAYCGPRSFARCGFSLIEKPRDPCWSVYTILKNALAVESQKVVPIQAGTRSGCIEFEASMRSVEVIVMQPVHELLRTARTATEVASAAQNFGQEDDISVFCVTRKAVLEPAAA